MPYVIGIVALCLNLALVFFWLSRLECSQTALYLAVNAFGAGCLAIPTISRFIDWVRE